MITVFLNCATYNNTSGASHFLDTNVGGVVLTADPFVNAAAGNFALNATAGGGAACRAAGVLGVFPGALSTGYLDIGAVQHADPAVSGNSRAVGIIVAMGPNYAF